MFYKSKVINMITYGLIPAFNEEKTIETVVKKLRENNEIIHLVVNDGSNDKTGEIAKEAGALVLTHEKNKGKGEAIKTGFNYILKQNNNSPVVIIDADLQYSPEEAGKVLTPILKGSADFVKGVRNFDEVPRANRIGDLIWRGFFNFFFGTEIKDLSNGYMALSPEALKKIKNIRGGYIIESSMLMEAIKNKLRIEKVPVSVKYGKRKIRKYARMFFGVLFFITVEGLKYRLGTKKT